MGERNLSGLGESLANPDHEEPEDEESEEQELEDQSPDDNSASESEVESEATVSNTQPVTAGSGADTHDNEDDSSSGFEQQDAETSQCQEITRGGTQCDHEAQEGSNYCKKHQPDKFGNRPRDFQRKQWNLLPEVSEGLFADSVTDDSLYIDVQKELGMNFQKKTVENKMGEFLLENHDEFIEFMKQQCESQK